MTESVCMLVRNDCHTDYRVLKSAASAACAGYSVTVIALNIYGPEEREQRDGFEIIRVPVERAASKLRRGINLFPRAIARMTYAARQVNADIYHAHDNTAILPAWLAARQVKGAKLLYDAHEVGFISLHESVKLFGVFLGGINWLWNCLNVWLIRRHVDATITVNDTLADLQAAHYHISRPVVVMNCPPHPVLPSEASKILAQTIGVTPEVPIMICQGMFSLDRGDGPGLLNLIESSNLLHRGVIVLIGNVGNAPQFEELRKFANQPQFSQKVFILPSVSPVELQKLTAGASVGLITLQLRGLYRYASPNKFFEYLNAGLPIVTSDIPPIRRICEDYECGLVCDPDSPASIAGAINNIIDDPALYASMRAGALRAAQIYNWENQEKVLLKVYQRLLEGGHA